MNNIKIAKTHNSVLEVIKNRWSPRAFSSEVINETQLKALFEAASWAASAMNEQPWVFLYAHKESVGYEKILSSLAEANQTWAKNASVLIVAIAKTTFENTGEKNLWAEHDLGMANAHLLLQATELGFYGHQMAGFNKSALINLLELPENQNPICVIALGYLADADTLAEPFKTRELTERKRKEIKDFVKKLE